MKRFFNDFVELTHEHASKLKLNTRPTIIKVEAWDGSEDKVVTINGKPIGQSVSPRDGGTISRWLTTAWTEIEEIVERKG